MSRLRILSLLFVIALAATLAVLPRPVSTHAALNPIQIENAQKGTTAWKLQVLSNHGEIQGYASRPSVEAGQTIAFSVSTTGSSFTADIYRMGWYGGAGARLMQEIPSTLASRRRIPKPQKDTGMIVCDWPVSFSVTIPSMWLSGIYLVKLTSSNTHQAYIPFTVTDPTSQSTYLFVHGLFTDEAYNDWGGKSLYTDIYAKSGQAYADRAREVSFLRPFAQNQGAGWFVSWEIHMVRFLEKNGYDVSYTTDLDNHEHPGLLLNHKAILVVGHDEYWSKQIRDGMDAAVAHGVNLADFAANTGYWQVRVAPVGSQPNEAIICYKTSKDPITKTDPKLTTTLWRNPPVNRPESELTGAMYGGYDNNRSAPYNWIVSNASSWIFNGSGLKNGSIVKHIVGQEADHVYASYPHPKDLQIVSRSPFGHNPSGSTFDVESTIYKAPGGAWVFDAASIDWSWGLDDVKPHPNYWLYAAYPNKPNPGIETITKNILNRFAS